MTAAIGLDGLTVRYGRHEAVRGIALTVHPTDWVALIGRNGAGKSSVLRAIAGLVPFTGQVRVFGHPVHELSRRTRAQQIALVPQLPVTPAEMTVAEFVLLGRTPHIPYLGTERRTDLAIARHALRRLRLLPFADRTLSTLSGGERQRVVLARALAQEAPVLLLDEPTSALDLGMQQQALELVDTLRRTDGLTILSTMHDLNLAGAYADRLVLLDEGEVVAEGTAAEVLSERSIATHFGARVRVEIQNGTPWIVPQRAGDHAR